MPIKEKTQREIIKEICVEFECTQKELAEKIGVKANTISFWTSDRRKIPEYFFKMVDFIREVRKLNEELKEKYKNK